MKRDGVPTMYDPCLGERPQVQGSRGQILGEPIMGAAAYGGGPPDRQGMGIRARAEEGRRRRSDREGKDLGKANGLDGLDVKQKEEFNCVGTEGTRWRCRDDESRKSGP